MFIKAAQRNPIYLDVQVQNCLAMLCHMSGEYEHVADCLRVAISNDKPTSRKTMETTFRICTFLFLANKPEEAISLSLKIAETEKFRYKAYRNIGFIHMYLKNYGKVLILIIVKKNLIILFLGRPLPTS